MQAANRPLIALPHALSHRPTAFPRAERKLVLGEFKGPAEGVGLANLVGQRGRLAEGGTQTGDSEIRGFRVERRHGLLVEGLAAGELPQFLDQLAVGYGSFTQCPDQDDAK